MEKLDLHEHNRIAYEKVKEAFLTQDRCCVIHPTGTGKSFICYALSGFLGKIRIRIFIRYTL